MTRRPDRDKRWVCSCGNETNGSIGHTPTCTAPAAGPGPEDGWRCGITAPHMGHGHGKRSCPGIDFPGMPQATTDRRTP
jgi:hypothetical protein